MVDSVGRIVVPKPLRESLRLAPGTKVNITAYGSGLYLVPIGRTARLVKEDGRWVAESDTEITDDDIFGLLDSIRR